MVELECATRALWEAYLTEYRGSESVQVFYFERSRLVLKHCNTEWGYHSTVSNKFTVQPRCV